MHILHGLWLQHAHYWRSLVVFKVGYTTCGITTTRHKVRSVARLLLIATLVAVRKETLLTDASATVWNSLDLP
jgi:hypothetical protein